MDLKQLRCSFRVVHPGRQNSMCTLDPSLSLSLLFRWCCSGTPVSTDIKEFIGQFAFLGVQPLAQKPYFNRVVHITLAALPAAVLFPSPQNNCE